VCILPLHCATKFHTRCSISMPWRLRLNRGSVGLLYGGCDLQRHVINPWAHVHSRLFQMLRRPTHCTPTIRNILACLMTVLLYLPCCNEASWEDHGAYSVLSFIPHGETGNTWRMLFLTHNVRSIN
jgi:hypothetical protein